MKNKTIFYRKTTYCFLILISLFANIVFGRNNSYNIENTTLKEKIIAITKQVQANVGVAIKDFSTGEAILINNELHFAMQSVYKLPLAMAVLSQIDKEIFTLGHRIHISKEDLLPNTWSPIREKYPDGNIDMTLADLLGYTVSQSDNNGCDMLFKLMGGAKKVNAYIQKLGITKMNIATNEAEMAINWQTQFTNWATPAAILQLLEMIENGTALSTECNQFLIKLLTETSTGSGRIKGLLPGDAVVAHKTGSSGTNAKGITGAHNDAGIVTLPNGKKLAIVVLVGNASQMDEASRDAVIAKIAKATWDYFTVN